MDSNTTTVLDFDLDHPKKIKFSPYLLFAFFVPAIIFLVIYLIRCVYPIGENSVLVLDLNAQYVYFFEEMRDVLQGEGSLLYSWQRAMGGEFMGMYAYYLASPFNLLLALFSEKSITEALLVIFVLKAGFSGFNFAVYLHYSGRAKNKYATVIFSTMYALTSYAIVNAHNSMWIDVLLFLPLVILGMEELINKGKYKLYTITLAVSVISNFYIGFMLCIFLVIYAVYYYLTYGVLEKNNYLKEKFHTLKAFLRVLFFSLLALAMAAVILFTIYYSLKFGKNDFSDPKYDFDSKFNFIELFAKMLPNSYDTVRPQGLPFVYCGVLSLILMPIFFISRKITPSEKIGAGFILSAMVITFSATTLDIFMHGMQKPNWLNYRYSFMFCFLLLVFAHQAFTMIKSVNMNHIVGTCGLLVILIALVQNEKYEYIDSVTCIWISIICVGVYLLALYAIRCEKKTHFTSLILAILVSTELLINGYVNLAALDDDVIFSSRTSYRTYIDEMTPVVDYIKDYDDSFYRFEKTSHRRTNDNMALDINGLSSSTSTLNASIVKLLNQLGYASKSHWSKYLGGTPAMDSLLGIKYIISDKDLNGEMFTKIHKEGKYNIYLNKYVQSIAFAVNERAEYVDYSFHETPFELMNELVGAMLGNDEPIMLFKPVENVKWTTINASELIATSLYTKFVPQKSGSPAYVSYTFNMPTDDELYFFYPSDYPRKVELLLNDRSWGTFFDNETDRIISLESYEAGDQVNLKLKLCDDNLYVLTDQSYFYYLDTEVYKDVMTRLNQNSFNVTKHSDTLLEGTITVSENNTYLYTTIPYDEGWKIYCDGERLDLLISGDSLLAADIPAGTHKLKLVYEPDCYTMGSRIATAGITLFVLIIIADTLIKRKRKKCVALTDVNEVDIDTEVTNSAEYSTSEPLIPPDPEVFETTKSLFIDENPTETIDSHSEKTTEKESTEANEETAHSEVEPNELTKNKENDKQD
ncbi:MAG: hypothetical protein E7615_02120 [Ruminococcaceae bacterium]|nr:hypothetical protein [Oscillospiraceae bacterium]